MTSVSDSSAGIGELGQQLIRHARILHMIRARLSAESGGGLDSGALSVLMHVVKSDGLRQGELAGCAMLDPSTVSRHVGLLVRLGHVERQPDQGDGRAVRLVATADGRAVQQQLTQRREALMREALRSWSDDDLSALTAQLRRLNDDFEAIRPQPGPAALRQPVLPAGPA
jgi:DNA-binding MarR family transcriptional regulator